MVSRRDSQDHAQCFEINGWQKWRKVFRSLFDFHVLRVKLVYDKNPSQDKSPPGSGAKWKRNFYDNGFRSEHAEQIYEEFIFMKMEFMIVAEISFSFLFVLLWFNIHWNSLRAFPCFIDNQPQLHGTMIASISINAHRILCLKTPKNVETRKTICLLFGDCVN